MKEQLLQKAKPILFNNEMVKAILDGRKTQTRRIAKLENIDCPYCEDYLVPYGWTNDMEIGYQCINEDCMHITSINQKPKYKVGDILYVRETFKIDALSNLDKRLTISFKTGDKLKLNEKDHNQVFEKFDRRLNGKWKPSIHMPKKYARIFRVVTKVKIERLQDITYEDILKEGCPYTSIEDALEVKAIGVKSKAFEWWINLWNATAKDGYKWKDNRYVSVYEFEKVEV